MKKSFLKMHGLGNDFAIFDERGTGFRFSPDQIRFIADRRRGVGCDQVIIMEQPKSPQADVFMRIYNLDGTEAEACGNASRCVGRLVMDEKKSNSIILETVAGLLPIEDKGAAGITVDMGEIRTHWQQIPLAKDVDTLNVPISEGGLSNPVAINVGNPHVVFFVPDAEAVNLAGVGPKIEHHSLLPARANVEVVQVLNRSRLRMRVWERGSGITQACGTAACATVAAAVLRGLADRTATVALDGGELSFVWRASDNHMLMTGPVALSYKGEVDV